MRKAACLVVTVALVLGGGAAFGGDLGEDCRKLNVILLEESTYVDHTDPEYVALAEYFGFESFANCWSQEVIGTIQGTWVLCWTEGLFIDDPFELGIGPELWGNPGIIHTRKGDIYTMSYGLSVWEYAEDPAVFVAFGGLTRFVDGTGAYEGATGWGTDAPKKYPASYWIQNHGFLCVPD